MSEYLETDVLILGSGIAGATAALELADRGISVVVATRATEPEDSNTLWAQGGIIYRGEHDSPDALAAYAGMTPTLWQSGRSSGTHFLSRRCNLHLRQACWPAALGSLKTPGVALPAGIYHMKP